MIKRVSIILSSYILDFALFTFCSVLGTCIKTLRFIHWINNEYFPIRSCKNAKETLKPLYSGFIIALEQELWQNRVTGFSSDTKTGLCLFYKCLFWKRLVSLVHLAKQKKFLLLCMAGIKLKLQTQTTNFKKNLQMSTRICFRLSKLYKIALCFNTTNINKALLPVTCKNSARPQ